jgi:16S rRNA U516 pseudouridylate synthase RsuA-like enzyme
MKPISLYVEEGRYRELKALAKARGQPVADLLREAMAEYLARARMDRSMLDIRPHASGKLKRSWRRHELFDEMRRR